MSKNNSRPFPTSIYRDNGSMSARSPPRIKKSPESVADVESRFPPTKYKSRARESLEGFDSWQPCLGMFCVLLDRIGFNPVTNRLIR
jgi:hypothetical protein